MSNILVCGDIHGRIEAVHELYRVAYDTNTHVVFVGDIVDSYGRTLEEEFECMNLVLGLAEDGLATLIYGNHELSYLYPHMICSRYDRDMAHWFKENRARIEKNFVSHTWVGDYLVTHAGLGRLHYEFAGATSVSDYFDNHTDRHHDIGFYRGGSAPRGGIYWSDYRSDFVPIPGVKQIFGHTQVPIILQDYPDNYCVDCLEKSPTVLSVDTDTNATSTLTLLLEEQDD